MITDFRLIGLSKPKSAKITLLENTDDTISIPINMTIEKANELFKYLEGDWETDKIAMVEHDRFNYDGFPLEGKLVGVRDWDLPFNAPEL